MKILYVAKHNQRNSNDDEGAITHSLRELGHEVLEVPERLSVDFALLRGVDFVLYHKWSRAPTLRGNVPLVCWYFDCVDYPDTSLATRNRTRETFVDNQSYVATLLALTDGSYVRKLNSKNTVLLPQGFDSRLEKISITNSSRTPPTIFTGSYKYGGSERTSWYLWASESLPRFKWINKSWSKRLINSLQDSVVVAPDSPLKPYYWSNRVWNTLGMGGCLVHPNVEGLRDYYSYSELLTYASRDELLDIVDRLATRPDLRDYLANKGRERTLKNHTYRHRVESLIKEVKERL